MQYLGLEFLQYVANGFIHNPWFYKLLYLQVLHVLKPQDVTFQRVFLYLRVPANHLLLLKINCFRYLTGINATDRDNEQVCNFKFKCAKKF
jgi:hypothetical protein